MQAEIGVVMTITKTVTVAPAPFTPQQTTQVVTVKSLLNHPPGRAKSITIE
jgi:hypothetical protein